MLGKTNVTALREGAIITDVEDYRWVRIPSGTYGDFVKAVYKNERLAAVTADGKVVHTADGEVWEVSEPGFAGCRFNDIEWDGSRFVLAGSCTDENTSGKAGLVLTTTDFAAYEKKELSGIGGVKEYLAVLARNGSYILVTSKPGVVYTDLERGTQGGSLKYNGEYNTVNVSAVKNTGRILVYLYERGGGHPVVSHVHSLCMVDGDSCRRLKTYDSGAAQDKAAVSLLECKDALYAMGLLSGLNYNLEKITDANEIMVMSTGQNFMFVDGIYFNGCQIFINSHEMLVVRKGEGLAGKTSDDLKEIAPEAALKCVAKAFGQLFLFGSQGLILRSSVETDNEGAIAVQTLSAKKALAEAKVYADQRIGELEKRIAELEKKLSGTSL